MDKLEQQLQKEYEQRTQNLVKSDIEEGISRMLALMFIKQDVRNFITDKVEEIKNGNVQ